LFRTDRSSALTLTTAATGHPIPNHYRLHTVPVRNLNADKCGPIAAPVCGFRCGVIFQPTNLPDIHESTEDQIMDSLFLGLLTLFFAQGLSGRDNWGARLVAFTFVVALGTAFVCSLH
jgi:hypothetical protein